MKDLILEAARGRELEFAIRYCGLTEGIGKEHRQPCPFCKGETRFLFIAKPRNCDYALFVCRQCGRGGSILNLLIATNRITYQNALETLASEVGLTLPDKPQKTQRESLRAVWEANRNDARMTIASLILVHCRFLPATDGVDFLEADIETIRKYAERIVKYPLNDLIRLLATQMYGGDYQKAYIALECLYHGKDIASALRKYNVDRAIQNIRMFANREEQNFVEKMEKEIQTELEKLTLNKERRMVG